MNFAIYGKTLSPEYLLYVQHIVDKLQDSGCGISVYEPFYEVLESQISFLQPPPFFNDSKGLFPDTDLLLSIGGDGTLLGTILLVKDSGIPVLGVNMGKLGFLSSVSKEEVLNGIDEILSGRYKLDQRSLLKVDTINNPFGDLNIALNDLMIFKRAPTSMITVQTWVNDEYLNSYWGDGLIISTPTGSTGYSMSCGGPIILPGSDNFVITPIATHNLTVRPMVIPDGSIIRIKVEGRDTRFIVGLDSRSCEFDFETEFIVRRAEFKIKLLQMENQNFFKTIRAKLNWGLDARN